MLQNAYPPTFLNLRNADILLFRGSAILIPERKLFLKSAERKTTCVMPARVLQVSCFMKERGMMSRQRGLIQLPLFGMTLLCLLAGVYLVAWKRFSKSRPSSTVSRHAVDTHPDDTLKYWTADKMRDAKAASLPNVVALKRGKQGQQRPPHPSNSPDA
jgi:hypothetical protein